MGSSTASETTINTSTDSANTMLTMVTTTDGEQPDDSFDLVDVPSEMSPATPAPPDPPPLPPLPAPLDKSSELSCQIDYVAVDSLTNVRSNRNAPEDSETNLLLDENDISITSSAVTQGSTTVPGACILTAACETRSTGAGSSGSGRTPALPDLRTADFFSTPVRGSVDAGQPDPDRLNSMLTLLAATNGKANVEKSAVKVANTLDYSKNDASAGKHGQRKPSVNVTANPLDISLIGMHSNDRFNGQMTTTATTTTASTTATATPTAMTTTTTTTATTMTATTTTTTTTTSTTTTPTVTTTSTIGTGCKPRGRTAGGTAAGSKRSAQAATIVVQQPSLSLDGSGGAATILLHPEVDVRRREENMRQLLDVANTLTLQEIRDFEKRYGSPHHSRSQSVKTPGSRSSDRPNYLCLPQQRSRVASMPNTGVEEECYRLRHFSIIGKGVVNRGDSLKSRRSRSNNSVASSNSSTEHLTASYPGSARNSAAGSLASSRESSASQEPAPYRVLMLGAPAVGKSSLVSQFMTSEYLHAYDTSIDDESGEKTVSVLLAGEESELTFIDHSCAEMTPETCIATYGPHAYCVVYSTTDRTSVRVAEEVLQTLWRSDHVSARAVILVGNKTDLVRSRLVSTEEGKSMATSYDCKFIETSVGFNHNVDELLVGLLTQIRLKLENPDRTRDLFRKRSRKNRSKSPLGSCSENNSPKKYRGSRTSTSLKVRNLLDKVWARDSKSKSCENLHVL